MQFTFLWESVIAGLVASVACGLGVIPLYFKRLDPKLHAGLSYGFAGGLMFSASVYNLILPGLTLNQYELSLEQVLPVLVGILLGATFLWFTDSRMAKEEEFTHSFWKQLGGRTQILIFIAMVVHSIPEGVAVGVGFTSEEVYHTNLGLYIAIAISIHNIPEGLAVGIPIRAEGGSMWRAFWMAFLTSLPQPIAAVPAALLSWFFRPLMPVLMGFAAGAMIFLILLELIPTALHTEKPLRIAWAFVLGFCLMLLVQVVL